MKYLTLKWWAGDEEVDPCPALEEHRKGIEPDLTDNIRRFVSNVCLHDANLLESNYIQNERMLTFKLHGYCYREGQVQYAGIHTLVYHDAELFRMNYSQDTGLPGPGGFGDLGYDEFHLHKDSGFEHHILFSSGIDMIIVFSDLDYSFEKEDTNLEA